MSLVIHDRILKSDQYLTTSTKKDTIYLHHTAGGHRADWTIDQWNRDDRGRIATAFVISGASTSDGDITHDGKVFRAFDPKYWAFHLGVQGTNGRLDKKSIGIEICNYGWVTLSRDGRFFNYVNKPVPDHMVYELPVKWRGYKYFHKYTDAQIESVYHLLKFLSETFSINVSKTWDINSFSTNADALKGVPGLWTHVNVRKDKTDCHPQPELIQMLNSL